MEQREGRSSSSSGFAELSSSSSEIEVFSSSSAESSSSEEISSSSSVSSSSEVVSSSAVVSSSSVASSSSSSFSSSSTVVSSSAVVSSSSLAYSSSVVVSSSSAVISSSSVASSSSVVVSSSSAVVSSSSLASSSSEVVSSSSAVISSSSVASSSSAVVSSSSLATYTVTYNAGTGVTGVAVPSNQTKSHDVALTLSTATPTRAGYTFAGWNTAANGSGLFYAGGTGYTDNANLTLYAQWTANVYTVTYDVNGGTGTVAAQTKTHDVELKLRTTVPTRTGYTFAGWNTETDGSGTTYASGGSYTANAYVTLYAQWTLNTYTLDCTGLAATGTAGTAITQPTVTCNGSDNTSTPVTNHTWGNAPVWTNPAAGTYNVSATATCGGSSKTASCGTLTIAGLACASVPTSGTYGTAITAPTVTCNGATISSGLSWTGAPAWANPAAGTYSNVSVSASSGDCSGKSATCSGTLTVASVLACANVPTSGTYGTAITAPTVTCNGTTISNGFSWTGAPTWANPAAGTYSNVSVSASSGDCSGKSVTCSGTLTVASVLACASVPPAGAAGTAITPPTVTCNGTAVSSGFSWTGAPTWANLEAGTYSNVSVSASSGDCSGKTATCNGTLIVQSGVIAGTPVTYGVETYQTVVIGAQTWFKQNLNYPVAGSKCGNGSNLSDANTSTCDTYGRLYNWATAMNLNASCNSSTCSGQVSVKHKGICPSGWHIPSNADWSVLMKFVNPSCSDNSTCAGAGTKLKATNGWNSSSSVPGTDDYGFSALPGGNGYSVDDFRGVGNVGSWWSSSEYDSNYASQRYMLHDDEYVYRLLNQSKAVWSSVRCLRD
ncbi:hypothetical protein R83H12_02318 [Fibrobacteria bacterium R8-3-H12]